MRISKFVSVRSMTSNSGNTNPNHQIITEPHGEVMVSYGTKICFMSFDSNKEGKKRIILDENYWDYSTTTGRFRNQFLGMGIQECREGIKDGSIELSNLN